MNYRKKRMEILSKIDALLSGCGCGCASRSSMKQRRECTNCQLIEQLGEELTNLNREQKEAEYAKRGQKIVPYRANNRDRLIMTVEEYLEFKRRGMNDKQIAEVKKVAHSTIGYFKKKHAAHLEKESERIGG